ncbi:MAG: hypothetical protein IJG24_03465 [Selenomonadaceae bacterium]|nr:hypothetical protein [Selenomonadaceae bacterium]
MERIIRRRLAGDSEFCGLLATFDTEPAIYYGKSPADMDAPESFYPQVILSADKFSDAQHGVAGLLTVDIICTAMTLSPEEIEPHVRRLLEGVFFRGEEVFILKWQRTDVFQEQNAERTPLIAGATMTFEIYELPSGLTAAPDPIQALQRWLAHWDENVIVIGLTDFGECFEPSREHPALWVSQSNLGMARQMNVQVFVTAEINLHVFAPGVQTRREWLTALYHALVFVKAIELDDHSPMRLQTCEFDFAANEIQGQLKTTWEYGLLRRVNYEHPLNHLTTEHADGLRRYDGYMRRIR